MRFSPLIFGLLVGCGSDAATVDAPIDACSSNASCTAPLGVCDVTGSKTCVECTAADHAACVGIEPVCGADQTCHACKAHSECTSEVCLPDGSCASEGDVAYVNGGTGNDVAACTRLAPCKTLTKVVTMTAKQVIKVTGTVDDRVTFANRNARIFADETAKLTSSGLGALLTVNGSSVVEIYDLAIADANGTGLGYGVLVPAATTAKVTLVRAKVMGCKEVGISASSGALTVTAATVTGNPGGGISISGGVFKIVNTTIDHNGTTLSAVGGVTLLAAGTGSLFEFNTVVDNDTSPGTSHAGGVFCDVVGFSANNNIVAKNRVSGSATSANSQTSGVCMSGSSAVQNDLTGLKFKSPDTGPFDYHLLVGSTAIDSAVTSSTVVVDIDGDVRPQGAGKDQGADEFKP